jgi:hypothetical protein
MGVVADIICQFKGSCQYQARTCLSGLDLAIPVRCLNIDIKIESVVTKAYTEDFRDLIVNPDLDV